MTKLELLKAQLDDYAIVYEETIENNDIVLRFAVDECDMAECTPEDPQLQPFINVRITPGKTHRLEIRFDSPSSVSLIRKLPA